MLLQRPRSTPLRGAYGGLHERIRRPKNPPLKYSLRKAYEDLRQKRLAPFKEQRINAAHVLAREFLDQGIARTRKAAEGLRAWKNAKEELDKLEDYR